MESEALAKRITGILNDKKALRTESFYVEKKTILTDYCVVCSGTSATHIRALAGEVEKELEKDDIKMLRSEGYESARWILLDFGTVIVHILHETEREYYDLETLFAKGHESLRR